MRENEVVPRILRPTLVGVINRKPTSRPSATHVCKHLFSPERRGKRAHTVFLACSVMSRVESGADAALLQLVRESAAGPVIA